MRKRSLKGQALITAGSGALVRALGFGLRLWLSRRLGAEALGIMELASGAHQLALTPAAAGLPGAMSHLTARAGDERSRRLRGWPSAHHRTRSRRDCRYRAEEFWAGTS